MKQTYFPPLAEMVALDLESAVLGFSSGDEIITPMYYDPFFDSYDENF